MADRSVVLASLALAVYLLCGCQSTQHSRAELAQICADPANRLPNSRKSLLRRMPGNPSFIFTQPREIIFPRSA